jgi:hypothetical protein
MDKTVKLWHISSTSCLKTFSHSDYGKSYLPLALNVLSLCQHAEFSFVELVS